MKSSKIVRLPLYAQIKDAILQKLSQREWKFDQPLPSESKMADEFGVSVGSIRHAVAELEDAGILIRRQGVGTFVRSYKDTGLWNRFQKFMRKDGRLPVFRKQPAKTGNHPCSRECRRENEDHARRSCHSLLERHE